MEYKDKIEIIEYPANPKNIEMVEGWANGRLIFRTVNGEDITPPELICKATHINVWKYLSKEEYEKIYGRKNVD